MTSRRLPAIALAGALATLAVCAIACDAVRRTPPSRAALDADWRAQATAVRALHDTVIDRLARRAIARGDDTLDLLFLSGGGQHGAYGAGFLRAWQTRAHGRMPHFDLVSGISTGSLEAPFALLGTPAALDTLAILYRDAAQRIAPTVDWWFWLRKTGGVVNASRYVATVARVVDTAFRAQLRAEFARDRQLLVGTTDMDLGIGRIWDLSHEMDTTAAGLSRARRVLVASTSIQGVFPPVLIDGHVHGDGGAAGNILNPLEFDDYQALATRLRARGVTRPLTVRLWVIVNIWTHPKIMAIDPASRSANAKRGNGIILLAQQLAVLQHLEDLARAVSTGIPGVTMEMRYTAVPSELANEPGADALFETRWMHRLEQLGYDRALSATPWDTVVTPYARPNPIVMPRPSSSAPSIQ